MDEKVKDKDADKAPESDKSNLEEGLEATFPGSDPVSATRQPTKEGEDDEKK